MKKWFIGIALISALAISAFAFAASSSDDEKATVVPAKKIVHGAGFVDLNGDGYNDNAPDADGDGIPNGQDPDFIGGARHRGHHGQGMGQAMGQGMGRGMGRGGHGRGFVDENGDGYNDNAPDADGDGIPNGRDPDFVRNSGTGRFGGRGPFFVDNDGDGVCDNLQTGRGGRKTGQGKGK